MKITSIALAALPLAAAAAKKLAGLPVDCVAFQDSDSESTFSTLGMGQCLKSGDAICSSMGSWAFGIDRTDGTVKLWEGGRVLFASSEWASANALCIGGNAAEYGPHEYSWYDEAAPYLFVSYDGGRSKAFIDCSGGGLTSAGDEAHLEINHIAETSIRVPNVPIVAFQDGAGTSSLWSIDALGAAQTNSGCEWRTDAINFTAELSAGEDFSSQTRDLVGLKQEEDDRTRWGYVLHARKGRGKSTKSKSPKSSSKGSKSQKGSKGRVVPPTPVPPTPVPPTPVPPTPVPPTPVPPTPVPPTPVPPTPVPPTPVPPTPVPPTPVPPTPVPPTPVPPTPVPPTPVPPTPVPPTPVVVPICSNAVAPTPQLTGDCPPTFPVCCGVSAAKCNVGKCSPSVNTCNTSVACRRRGLEMRSGMSKVAKPSSN